jgi:hypothetical protein
MKTRFLFINLFALCLLLLPLSISAQDGGGIEGDPSSGGGGGIEGDPSGSGVISINIENPVKGATNLYQFIVLIINNLVLPLGGVIAVLYIMYAGFLMVTARGDTKQIEDGRRAFTNAAIGTAILLGAWVIAEVVESTIDQIRNV